MAGRTKTPSVAIVGAGLSGICMGIKLMEAGIESFTIYEKAEELGGTWRDNTYPGLVCDTPSRYYSYSFAPNPDWSSCYAPGPEIHRYLLDVAERYGVRRHIRFGAEVESARFEGRRWCVTLRGGEQTEVDVLISSCGVSHYPREPDIPGLDSFAGPRFHSARWDHDVELRGKRIGVVGTGSSGVQIVSALADVSRRLTHFQRTPQWIIPLVDFRYRERARRRLRRFPALNRIAYRFWQSYIERGIGIGAVRPGATRTIMATACRLHLLTVRDPELRRRLTPDYEPMCKRLISSGSFYRAVQKPHVDVVTEAIERIEPTGIVTRDGRLHELDVLVLATGFDSHAYLRRIEIVGPDGNTLEDAWRDRVWTYRTVALPGFPNLLMLIGPHSPIGNRSLFLVAEHQADYIVRWIQTFANGEIVAAAPTEEATERFNRDLRAAMPDTVWASGCDSWYLGPDGVPEVWPWTPDRHDKILREVAVEEFEVRRPTAAPGPVAAEPPAAYDLID